MNRLQIQDDLNEQDIYIPIRDEKDFKEGSIELYQSVLNECLQNNTVEPFVKDYILNEYKGLKLLCKSRKEIYHLAESLQQELNRWEQSPECKEQFRSSMLSRARRNQVIWMISSGLAIALGSYAQDHDLPAVGKLPSGLNATLLILGSLSGGISLLGIRKFCIRKIPKKAMFTCVTNRLFSNLRKEYLCSIFSSKSFTNDREFKGFENSQIGKIEGISNITLDYLK